LLSSVPLQARPTNAKSSPDTMTRRIVMAGLVPAIHVLLVAKEDMDARQGRA
jgi:hypothetical protein